MDRIFYSSSVHDEREIEAVVEVLRSGPQGLWPGRRVVAMERQVAVLFGKQHGVMCNSGSSALYLALELLDLPKGAEVVTCALTFSTDVAPIVRGGWVPAFVDVQPGTYCVDVDAIEAMITPATGAILMPNLIGNAPDWDRILEQLKKLPANLERRRRNFQRYTEFFGQHEERFVLPIQLDGLETAWLGYPLMIRPGAGFQRADLQQYLDGNGIDTRTIWTGNVTRQPMLRGVEVRVPDAGLPHADAVMERGVLLPLSHALDDDTLDYVTAHVATFLATR